MEKSILYLGPDTNQSQNLTTGSWPKMERFLKIWLKSVNYFLRARVTLRWRIVYVYHDFTSSSPIKLTGFVGQGCWGSGLPLAIMMINNNVVKSLSKTPRILADDETLETNDTGVNWSKRISISLYCLKNAHISENNYRREVEWARQQRIMKLKVYNKTLTDLQSVHNIKSKLFKEAIAKATLSMEEDQVINEFQKVCNMKVFERHILKWN